MKTAAFVLGAALVLSACASAPQNADAQLNNRVKQDIAQTQGIGSARSVNVESHQGVVILSGFIGDEKQKQDAAQAALKVAGVKQVFNNLQLLNQTSSGR